MTLRKTSESVMIHTKDTSRQAHSRGVQKIRKIVVKTTIEIG